MQNLVALSQTVWQRVNGLVVPPSWVEVIYVIPLYEVSRGLNLNFSSVGGRSLKLTDYYWAEARHYLPDQAKIEAETMRQSRGRGSKVETEARPCEAEARPSQLKKTVSRPPRAEADASRIPSLGLVAFYVIWSGNGAGLYSYNPGAHTGQLNTDS